MSPSNEETMRTHRGDSRLRVVENVAVRTTELTEAWQETGQNFVLCRVGPAHLSAK